MKGMPNRAIFSVQHHDDVAYDSQIDEQTFHDTLVANLENALAVACPRLQRFARAQGITADATDDVVQETLLEAWRHLHQLRTPDRLHSWLYGICRNVCLRWKQAQQKTILRQVSLSPYAELDWQWEEAIADPFILDPVEELSQQDLSTLLDRALGYLPDSMREPVELCYLENLPQHEAALRLGLTVKALETRLLRAKHQLRQVLSNELHEEAQAFGLALNQGGAQGWHETRIWCMFCARHYLQGRFDPRADGCVNMRLRCPDCMNREVREWVHTGYIHEMRDLKSFRAALNRVHRLAPFWSNQVCPACHAAVLTRLMSADEIAAMHLPLLSWQGLRWVIHCSSCDSILSSYASAWTWSHPVARQFMAEHPRWINEPETLMHYQGQPAIRVRLTDILSAARLTFLLRADHMMQVLAILHE